MDFEEVAHLAGAATGMTRIDGAEVAGR